LEDLVLNSFVTTSKDNRDEIFDGETAFSSDINTIKDNASLLPVDILIQSCEEMTPLIDIQITTVKEGGGRGGGRLEEEGRGRVSQEEER
jgi:hypothetical protein